MRLAQMRIWKMNHLVGVQVMKSAAATLLTVALLTSLSVAGVVAGEKKEAGDVKPFAGFPEIRKYRPGRRSREVITSDGVQGLLRPKWTRPMTDLGGWPCMFRFKRHIYFVFYHGDGHR